MSDVQSFLDGTVEVEFSITDKDACYKWMQHTLVKLSYLTCSKKEKGLIARYLGQVSGYSPCQVKRLIQQYRKTGYIKRQQRTVADFERFYRTADAVLLAETDKLHGTLSGGATRKICERMLLLYDDARYERLAKISVSHLYNLRHSNDYQRQRCQFDKTHPKRSQIGERRKPTPEGIPGYLRIDTVHQGNLDGIKGVYHINAVDEVTQFECVFSVERITERFMIPVLEMIIETFPFVVHACHADNGSEYINYRVSKLLGKLHIEFTKSRPRHSNDNALAESKKGKVRKSYPYKEIMTP
ncbi:MAG: transposase family protein, partial [Gammaproteobacteria bacterium]|nr:transposase family protein [Gammaproteobacteria bacterium]